MLNALIRLSLRYRALVVFLALATLVYGSYTATRLPIDVLPDLDRPRVVVLTEAHGLSPEDVETMISFPLEAAMLGAAGVESVRSSSGLGLSVVYVDFGFDVGIQQARQTVQERLASVQGSLPEGIRPQMAPVSSLMGQIMIAGIYRRKSPGGADPEDMELRTLADWVIRPRLMQIPGVAQIITMGGGRKQYQVLLDPLSLQAYGVRVDEVARALRRGDVNTSGGFTERDERELVIRILGRLGPEPNQAISQLLEIPVKSEGERPVLLGQVARVVLAPATKRGDAGVDGEPAVALMITKQPHADTRSVTAAVLQAFDELQPTLPEDVVINPHLFQLRAFIDRGIFNVSEALVLGAFLVLIILFVFLLNLRTTFISLAAIPLSLTVTALVFKIVGWLSGATISINVMTLGGIAVALGELVDDAIVDVENIYRRLKENRSLPHPRPILEVIYKASVEIRSAIVFGTLMVILVFFPVFALSGIEGRLFTPLGIAYITSILASLLVSLTVTPVLSWYLLPNMRDRLEHGDGLVLRILKRLTTGLVRVSLTAPGWILLAGWVGVALAAWQLTQLGGDLLPEFDEGSVQINVFLPPGSSLSASTKVCAQVDAKLQQLLVRPESPLNPIRHFVRRTGRAELDEHVEPVSNTEYILNINPQSGLSREELLNLLQTELRREVPEAGFEVEQPLSHMLSHMVSGVSAHLAIKIYGEDMGVLRRLAEEVQRLAASNPRVRSAEIEGQKLVEELHLRLRSDALAFYGLDRESVAHTLETALAGEIVGQVLEGQRRFDLIVRLDEPYRSDLATLGRLQIGLPNGSGQVSLSELADIEEGLGPTVINRENARRRISVRVNIRGGDLAGTVEQLRQRIREEIKFPPGYFAEFGGRFETQKQASRLIWLLILLSGVGMFVLLYVLFPSWKLVLQVMNSFPMAFIGGVLALVLTGQTQTVACLVGFISLGGIATRNAILLTSHYIQLLREEAQGLSQQLVLRGTLERVAPVLMTALSTGIGLVPLVLDGDKPGREILYPVATVILGGLITSTFSQFLIHPGLFWHYTGRDAERIVRAGAGSGEGEKVA